MPVRHFTTISDLSVEEIEQVYKLAAVTKSQVRQGIRSNAFGGRTLGMIFEKPSMRTRLSFEIAMIQAGGHALNIRGEEIGLGRRESVQDVAKVMSRYLDAIMIRTFAHANVQMLARYATIPIVNGLSDYVHPCQALSDIFTIREKLGEQLKGRTLAFVGDGNNVARSLAMICTMFGMNFILAAPAGHEFSEKFISAAERQLKRPLRIKAARDPLKAVAKADVIYTDIWASMGQEKEAEQRRLAFKCYQVNGKLLATAPKDALIMHCLPAHRGEEITDEALKNKRTIIFDQAENRLHVQKGLLFFLFGIPEVW